jgi:hypothetical protein
MKPHQLNVSYDIDVYEAGIGKKARDRLGVQESNETHGMGLVRGGGREYILKNGVFWDVTPCDSCNN